MNSENIFSYIESMRTDMVNTLGNLISFPSFSQIPSEGAPFGKPARECLDKALEICSRFGLKTKNIDGYAGIARLGDNNPILGILAHLDVVPAGDGWTHKPYLATLEDGVLYGRGAMDDKGPAVSVMYALKALKDLNVPLKNGVELIMGTDEECGSKDIAYLKTKEKLPKWVFTPDASYPLINIEKGRVEAKFCADAPSNVLVELHGGRTINAIPASAWAVVNVSTDEAENAIKKTACSVKFRFSECGGAIKIEAEGLSAHASTPNIGNNALTALVKLLSLISLDEPAASLISGLTKIFPYGETDGKSAGIKASDDVSGSLTLAFSILDLKDGELSGAMDVRFPVCESVKSIDEKLGASFEKIGFKPHIVGVEPHCVPSDSPFIKELLGAYQAVTGIKGGPMAIGGGTYVHNIPGGVAFGCEIEGEDNRIHGADEFIRVDALVENAKVFAEAILRICNNSDLCR